MPDDPRPLDSNDQRWTVPSITWDQVRSINKVLRDGVADLQLPIGPDRQPLTDLHHPAVQQWFLTWSPATIVVGAVLLADQATLLKVNEREFAARWAGDAGEQLKAAIWREWLAYLPLQARQHSEEIAREISARRAVQAQTATGLIDLMVSEGHVIADQAIQELRAKIYQARHAPTAPKIASGSPEPSASIPGPGATASSRPCTSPRRTTPGPRLRGKPHPSEPAT